MLDMDRLYLPLILIFTLLTLVFRPSVTLQSRIVGGSEIDIEDIPFVLSLRMNNKHACGATILSENWASTAAHCVTTYVVPVSNYSVRSGSASKDCGGEIHNVTKIIYHEKYNDENSDYDIAVLKVDPPFHFDDTTRPVDLPGNGYINDSWGIVAGWGYYMARSDVISKKLRYAELPKVDRNKCAQDYAGRDEVTPQQVCYGYDKGGVDACKGDSGGPLFTEEHIIIGIISWGEECGGLKSPGVYTTMFLMLDWIAEKTGVKSRL